MTSKIFGSFVALVLACATATAADIRRVVTALDGNDRAIALFDSRVTLEPGATPSAKLWVRDAAPAPLPFTDDSAAKPTALPPDLGTALLVVEFPPLDPAEEAKLDPEDHRRARIEAGPSRAASADAPHAHRRLRRRLVRRDRHDARRLGGARARRRCDRPAGNQSRLDQSRHAARAPLCWASRFPAAGM